MDFQIFNKTSQYTIYPKQSENPPDLKDIIKTGQRKVQNKKIVCGTGIKAKPNNWPQT